jgi:CheY-like chemotaxis protein
VALETLVLTADANVMKVVCRAMEKVGAEVIAVDTSAEAAQLLSKRKFDAAVIDCDENAISGATALLREIRRGTSNRSSIVFALISGPATSGSAMADGANFVLPKPLDQKRVARSFQSALGLMQRENRRYFRLAIELPVTVEIDDAKVYRASTLNLSKKGLAVKMRTAEGAAEDDAAVFSGIVGAKVQVHFALPDGRPIQCEAEVAWKSFRSDGVAGLQILAFAGEGREQLADFLEQAADHTDAANPARHRQSSRMVAEHGNLWQKLRRLFLRRVRHR